MIKAMAKKPVLTEYNVKSEKLKNSINITFLADLHERPYEDLIPLIKKSAPDIILIGGDTLERYDKNIQQPETRKRGVFGKIIFNTAYCYNYIFLKLFCRKNASDTERTYNFFREICKIAPVISSVGNHEQKFLEDDLNFFKELSIEILDNSDTFFYINGEKLRIGGFSSFTDEKWLKSFSEKDGFKILLCHHPIFYDIFPDVKSFDVVLSGHNHGGQIRIKDRGLLSSGEGFFPKYDKGIYYNKFIVTAGCANTVALPRINNPREIVKINLGAK